MKISPMNWSERLACNGFVQLHHFLPEAIANDFRRKILKASQHRAWCLLTRPYYPSTAIKDRISSKVIDRQRHQQAVNAQKRGQYAFSFYRSNNHDANNIDSGDIPQQFGKLLLAQVQQPLAVTGGLWDVFFALFKRGQFISYHSDGKVGRYAFVYQLSKGWRNCYGGQLELFPAQHQFYKKTIQPEFNTLVLLKLDHPMFHRVRTLTNPPYKHRITITGWLE